MKVLLIAALTLITATSTFAQRRGGAHHGGGHYGGGYYGGGHYGQQQNQRFPLQINQHLRGFNVIALKKELKMQYPGVAVRDLNIKAVRVVAKSKMGRAQVTLISGQTASYPETIGGTPQDFHINAGYTFDKIRIQNPQAPGMKGKLQLELQGNIKVKRVVIIASQAGFGGRNIVLDTYGQHLRGFNVLKLKQMIKQQRPGMNLQMAQLQKVTLIAKSKAGMGQATLIVGQTASYPATITGNPRMFHSNAPRSFSQVTLLNPAPYKTGGRWQVELQGNIKVDQVIITLKGPGHVNPRVPRTPRRPIRPRY